MQEDEAAQAQRFRDMETAAKEKFAREESAHLRKLEQQMHAEEERLAGMKAEMQASCDAHVVVAAAAGRRHRVRVVVAVAAGGGGGGGSGGPTLASACSCAYACAD